MHFAAQFGVKSVNCLNNCAVYFFKSNNCNILYVDEHFTQFFLLVHNICIQNVDEHTKSNAVYSFVKLKGENHDHAVKPK